VKDTDRKINELEKIYSGNGIFDIGALIEPICCAYNGIFIAGGGFITLVML
jgi:hypothetical protein